MAHELEKLRQQLTRLGLASTLASLETELQSRDPVPSLNPVVVQQQPSFMSSSSVNDNTDSPFQVFAIRTTPGGTDSPVNGRRNCDEDAGTPLSFSGQSFTSNASTGGLIPTLELALPDSPFALQSGAEDTSPCFGNYDWLTPQGSPRGPVLTDCTPDFSPQSLGRVDSLNDIKIKSESVFGLQSEPLHFEEVSVDMKRGVGVEWEDSEASERGKEGLNESAENARDLFQEIFSFPPTPAGSETGSGTALRQLSSLSSRTLSDLVSSESIEKICPKMKPTTVFCGQDPIPSSPFSPSSETVNLKEEGGEKSQEIAKRKDGMKRVSLTLSHNALQWASIPTESFFPIIQEQSKTAFPLYPFSQDYIDDAYDLIELKIYHRRGRTGFESSKDLYVDRGDVIAGRYQVLEEVGSAVFSKAIKALDLKEDKEICLKMVKNVKDYFDQSLDEIKLLRFVNGLDPEDQQGVVRLLDYFYYREHLFLVFELLKQNLYELQRQSLKSCGAITSQQYYFSLNRIQKIAKQLIRTLQYLHSKNIIHSDLKPENILIKDLASCTVKVIDLGSSCFITDYLETYIQSRSYRAPEVVLGVDYDQKVDLWSLGCILVELFTGQVLFQNSSSAELVRRIEDLRGPMPGWMIKEGKHAHQFYNSSGKMLKSSNSIASQVLKCPGFAFWGERPPNDQGFHDFVSQLLIIDPKDRPSAQEIARHPWLTHN